MPRSPDLRIIIPAYNEAARIEPTVRGYCETFFDIATVLVVANGCSDSTVQIVERLKGDYDNLELIVIAAPIGKGGAVRTGLWTGAEEFLGFVDADGSTSAHEYRRLFEILRNSNDDALIGSRWMRGSHVEPRQPLKRRIASRAFNAIVQLLFGLPYVDTQCGAKLFRRRAIAEVAHSLELANFAFDIEVLWRLRRAAFSVREVPTYWSDRLGGTVRLLGASSTMLKSIVRLRIRDSALWLAPFVDRFAHNDVIPVIDQERILVLGNVQELCSLDQSLAVFFNELRDLGFKVVGLEDGGTTLRRLRLRSDRVGVLATVAWYALSGHRDCEAVVEIFESRPRVVPSFTLKPSFVVLREQRAGELNHRDVYTRSVYLDLGQIDARAAAQSVALTQRGASRYPAAFFTLRDEIALHCPSERGDWQQHSLRP